MVSKEKVVSKSLKWKNKWDKRQVSHSGKTAKWKSKWARKSAKTARRFGDIGSQNREEHFYIDSHF